jgi:hypothetical protein
MTTISTTDAATGAHRKILKFLSFTSNWAKGRLLFVQRDPGDFKPNVAQSVFLQSTKAQKTTIGEVF